MYDFSAEEGSFIFILKNNRELTKLFLNFLEKNHSCISWCSGSKPTRILEGSFLNRAPYCIILYGNKSLMYSDYYTESDFLNKKVVSEKEIRMLCQEQGVIDSEVFK